MGQKMADKTRKCGPKQVAGRFFGTSQGPALLRATPCLMSTVVMKKKKRVDHQVKQQREAKTRRRLERAIMKLELKGRKLKPIDEINGEKTFMKSLDMRKRQPPVLSFEESEERALLIKDWARYKNQQNTAELEVLATAMQTQERALAALREESEELYQQAIQIDPKLMPFQHEGPNRSPPIASYISPDGDYTDTTKKYDKTTGHIDVNKLRF